MSVPSCTSGAGATAYGGATAVDSKQKKSTWHLYLDGSFGQEKDGVTRYYVIDQKIGFGLQAEIWTIIGKGAKSGKTKIAKITSYDPGDRFPYEYLVSSKYPNKSVGLMLKTKAYLKNKKDKILIMHKYDGDISIIIASMTNEQKIEAILQLAKGLSTLHDLGIIHYDVGIKNILYDRTKKRYDLGDFGLSRDVKDENEENHISRKVEIRHFKNVIKSILIGEEISKILKAKSMHSSEQVLNTKEDVLRLGYSEKVSSLIIDFMINTPGTMDEVCKIFDNVKKAFFES